MLCATEKAQELTDMGKGKHHIGDFLPPEELEKFVETVNAVKEDRDPGMYNPSIVHPNPGNIGRGGIIETEWNGCDVSNLTISWTIDTTHNNCS